MYNTIKKKEKNQISIELKFCVFSKLHRLKETELCINTLLVVFQIVKNKKSDRKYKSPVTTYCSSIVSHGTTIRRSTSEYFPIKGCSLHLYNHDIQCHNTRDDISDIPSMSWHSNNNMPGNVFNVHTNVSIETKLFTFEIRAYGLKHFFRNMPQCARSACISSLLIDFSQHTPLFPQLHASLAA